MRRARLIGLFVALAGGGMMVSACTSTGDNPFASLTNPTPTDLPPLYKPEEIVGRWGIASYTRDADKARTEAAARKQCAKAYTISKGPTGGLMMHQPDQTQPTELRIKSTADARTFIGPAGDPGGAEDREILSFNGRVMITRYVDPELTSRYGTMVYVRCGPRA
jgi:hypothetical protein